MVLEHEHVTWCSALAVVDSGIAVVILDVLSPRDDELMIVVGLSDFGVVAVVVVVVDVVVMVVVRVVNVAGVGVGIV